MSPCTPTGRRCYCSADTRNGYRASTPSLSLDAAAQFAEARSLFTQAAALHSEAGHTTAAAGMTARAAALPAGAQTKKT